MVIKVLEVREYSTFTEDTRNLVNWLVSENITTVAYGIHRYLLVKSVSDVGRSRDRTLPC